MPSFLTHWYILIETARRSQDAGNDLGSLIIDRDALYRRLQTMTAFPTPPNTTPAGAVWNTGPLPTINYRFPGSDISAMAFLGALAPDVPAYRSLSLLQRRLETAGATGRLASASSWSSLLHTNRTGDFIVAMLEAIASIPSPALRSQALAFAMGYLTHMATDLAFSSYIQALSDACSTQTIPHLKGLLAPQSLRFHLELSIDNILASRYFGQGLYDQLYIPWRHYTEPALGLLTHPDTLSARVLDVLAESAETIYGLSEQQRLVFLTDYRQGLRNLRRYLAGQGAYLGLMIHHRRHHREDDPIQALLAIQQRQEQETLLQDVLAYALLLSERFCRRAISYYAALRNSEALASERNQRLALLREDVRNWDLTSGYTFEVSFDETVVVRLLHNQAYFSTLWEHARNTSTGIKVPLTESGRG